MDVLLIRYNYIPFFFRSKFWGFLRVVRTCYY
nr:MAG TPA: hypothetical protein [Caudoviricetes sp.]